MRRVLHTLLLLIASVAECLMLSRVSVPQYKLVGEEALLRCDYDLGRNRLYAVKWYKDNEEFFRYVPRYNPPIYTHIVEGVRVESSKSNDKRVLIRSLAVRSTGVYRCEVSAEAPSFASIMGEGRMTVVYLPKESPQITGVNLKEDYEVGDVLDLNCTSAKSFPPAKLSWYINDSPVEVPWSVSLHPAPTESPVLSTSLSSHHHHHRHNVMGSVSYLMISTLRLQLPLEAAHFGRKGTAKVRCVARISPLFWQDGDERIFGQQNQNHPGRHSHSLGKKDKSTGNGGEGGGGERSLEENNKQHNYNSHNENVDNLEEDERKKGNEGESNYNRRNNLNLNHPLGEGEEIEGDIYEENEKYYYGIMGLPAFQREALVLVKGGGCSTMGGGWGGWLWLLIQFIIKISKEFGSFPV